MKLLKNIRHLFLVVGLGYGVTHLLIIGCLCHFVIWISLALWSILTIRYKIKDSHATIPTNPIILALWHIFSFAGRYRYIFIPSVILLLSLYYIVMIIIVDKHDFIYEYGDYI
jgi:hypothetical protein